MSQSGTPCIKLEGPLRGKRAAQNKPHYGRVSNDALLAHIGTIHAEPVAAQLCSERAESGLDKTTHVGGDDRRLAVSGRDNGRVAPSDPFKVFDVSVQQSSHCQHTIAPPIFFNRYQMNRSLAAAALFALCSVANAGPAPDTNNGFLTGKLFQGGSQSLRTAYVIGVLDGFSYAPAFGAPDAKVGKLQRCIGTLHADARQVGTIIDKYLEAHPESLNEKMQPIVLRAMQKACEASGTAID